MVRIPIAVVLILAARGWAQPELGDAAAMGAGAAIYARLCGACHGAEARGGEAPDLTRSALVATGSANDLFKTIHAGVRGTYSTPRAACR